jgi:hypothetical protein
MDDNNREQQLAEEITSSLGDEGLRRLAECDTEEEALAALADEGIELPDEALDQVIGGVNYVGALERGFSVSWNVLKKLATKKLRKV